MAMRYGFTAAEWDAAKEQVTALLGDRVMSGTGPTTYGKLASRITVITVGPHDYAMFHLLGDVSIDEDDNGRGMLSAYVITADTGMPGPGFFELAAKLGRDTDDPLACWIEEVERVDAAWGKT